MEFFRVVGNWVFGIGHWVKGARQVKLKVCRIGQNVEKRKLKDNLFTLCPMRYAPCHSTAGLEFLLRSEIPSSERRLKGLPGSSGR